MSGQLQRKEQASQLIWWSTASAVVPSAVPDPAAGEDFGWERWQTSPGCVFCWKAKWKQHWDHSYRLLPLAPCLKSPGNTLPGNNLGNFLFPTSLECFDSRIFHYILKISTEVQKLASRMNVGFLTDQKLAGKVLRFAVDEEKKCR